MAVTSRIATLRIDDGVAGDFRQWVATAALQDTAAGSSVVITTTQTSGGATPPAVASTLTLDVFIDSGATQVISFTLTPGSASQTSTFVFTLDGTGATANRAGTLRMRIHAVNTVGLAAATYNVDTDLTNNTPPTTFTVTTHDQGWIRGTTTSTSALSNVALGGAQTAPAQYNESLFVRTTLGSALYTARALTVALSAATPALSGATNSASSGNFDATFTSVVDNRYPAAVTSTATSLTVPNATLTALPDFTVTATNDAMNVDPRLTCAHLLMRNSNTFASPPLSSTALVTNGQRLTSDLDFASVNVRSARGSIVGNAISQGQNGINITSTFQDVGALSAAQTATSTTSTNGGEAGWKPTFLNWSATLPGGTWTKTVVVNTPANIVGAAYLLNSSISYTLLAPNPNYRSIVACGASTVAADGDHWHAGLPLLVGFAIVDTNALTTVALDPSPPPFVMLGRFNLTLGRAEYLTSTADVNGSLTWAALTGGTAQTWPLTVSPGDPRIWLVTFSAVQTAAWGTADLFPIGVGLVAGTPYTSFGVRDVPALVNSHSKRESTLSGLLGLPSPA